MAIKKRTITPRKGRQVSLTRDKTKPSPAKNTIRTVKAKRKITVSWKKIGKTFSVALVGCLCALVVAAVSVSLLYGYRYFTRSEYFSLRDIEIQGNSRLTSREILEIADLEDGVNLLELSLDEVRMALSRNPWVKEVSVKRELPSKLVIGIKERDPAFWVLLQGEMHYADEKGSVIAPVGVEQFLALPTLEVEHGAEEAAAGLPDLVRSIQDSRLPLDMRTVSLLRLSASREVELFVENSQIRIAIGLEEWLANLDRLDKTLRDLKRRGELQQVRQIKAQGTSVWVEKG